MLVTFGLANMKQTASETKTGSTKANQLIPPPPPPSPLPRFLVSKTVTESVTNQEIAKFWRRRRIEEEDHLLAAIKAAARIRARNFTEGDYKRFEETLKDDINNKEKRTTTSIGNAKDEWCSEVHIGIKDWWTKSKYAYLNQPAVMESMDPPPKRRTSTYTPNCFSYKATPLYPTSLGVF